MARPPTSTVIAKVRFAIGVLMAAYCLPVQSEGLENNSLLYPFVREGKWGYIDSKGTWVIQPRFDRCIEITDVDKIRVWQRDLWGYINRQGEWLVRPQFSEHMAFSPTSRYEVVSIGKKQGILADSTKLILPAKYEETVLFDDRAWVRSGQKLGLFGLDGRWILPPSLDWPSGRQMPLPTEHGVSWFTRGTKWGLLARGGKILFEPQFAGHVMGRKEAEEWEHPEGLDFKNGRAWVVNGQEYWLITDDGKVLCRKALKAVREWTNDLYVFQTKSDQLGLISATGDVVLEPRFSEIRPLREGMAVVTEKKTQKKANGETDTSWSHGYVDEQGKIVVAPGTYNGPGMPDGGQTELTPFSDGRAPVWNSAPNENHIYDPWAGFIDRTGALVIPEMFRNTCRFFEGLAAVSEQISGHGGSYSSDYQWGYVDPEGKIQIRPQFGMATPFCRDRAWVLILGGKWDKAEWAMIDRTGKVLTDYAYEPPERRNIWRYPEDTALMRSRWRGDLAVLARYDFHTGLAAADGTVLVEPNYNRIGDFHDGVAVAMDSRQYPKFITLLITDRGEVLANDRYTEISDFNHGVAWASHRWTDHRGPYHDEGWALIDTKANELSECKYVKAHWVWQNQADYTSDQFPQFAGELAPVALADGFKLYADKVWLENSWGYINRAGKVVAWHEKQPKP